METERHGYGDLFKHGEQIDLQKGEIFHRSDENCQAMGMVLSGEVRLSRVLSSGKEIFLKDFRVGDLFAEIIVFTAEQYPGWLIASEPSRVIEVKQSHVLNYFGANDILTSYLAGISKKMAHLSRTIEVLSLKTVKQKIAFSLLYENMKNNRIRINVSRFAADINSSREAVSRELTLMESEGLLKRDRGFLIIRDEKRLESII